eukprot:4360010-Prymnesium_polylepis.2
MEAAIESISGACATGRVSAPLPAPPSAAAAQRAAAPRSEHKAPAGSASKSAHSAQKAVMWPGAHAPVARAPPPRVSRCARALHRLHRGHRAAQAPAVR